MDPIESEGKTVNDAVNAALAQTGLRRDQVEVDVIQEPVAGVLGFGAKPAKVRITEKRWGAGAPPPLPAKPAPRPERRDPSRAGRPHSPERRGQQPPRPEPRREPARAEAPRGDKSPREERRPEPRREEPRRQEPRQEERRDRREDAKPVTAAEGQEACAKAQTLVTELLKLMSIAAPTVTTSWDADLERVKAVVESQDATLLVGRDGRVLEALQFIATLMLARGGANPIAVQVDALSYWEKKEQAVLDTARHGVESVKASGKPYRLEPMDASMRRLIHRSLASHPDVVTGSEGEGPWRKLVIRPRGK